MKLIKTSLNNYVWLYGPGEIYQKFFGGVLEAMHFGTTYLGIPNVEVIYGVADLVNNNNEVAEFGDVKGLFLFSRKGYEDALNSSGGDV